MRKRQIASLSPFKNTNASTLSLFAVEVRNTWDKPSLGAKWYCSVGFSVAIFIYSRSGPGRGIFKFSFFFFFLPRKGNSCQQQTQKHAVSVIFCFQMKWNVFGEPRGMLMRQVQWRWTLWAAPWPLLWLPCVQSTAQRLERCPKGGMAAFPLHWDSCLWTFINTGLISKDTKESKCLAIVPGLLHRAFFVPKIIIIIWIHANVFCLRRGILNVVLVLTQQIL